MALTRLLSGTPVPSRALLVTNEFGEILICVAGPFIVPGCDTSDGRSPAGVCWRALKQGAQSFGSKNPLRGKGKCALCLFEREVCSVPL